MGRCTEHFKKNLESEQLTKCLKLCLWASAAEPFQIFVATALTIFLHLHYSLIYGATSCFCSLGSFFYLKHLRKANLILTTLEFLFQRVFSRLHMFYKQIKIEHLEIFPSDEKRNNFISKLTFNDLH